MGIEGTEVKTTMVNCTGGQFYNPNVVHNDHGYVQQGTISSQVGWLGGGSGVDGHYFSPKVIQGHVSA